MGLEFQVDPVGLEWPFAFLGLAKAFEPSHKFFVSQNWKSLIERRPDVAPKAKQELERDLLRAEGFPGRWAYQIQLYK